MLEVRDLQVAYGQAPALWGVSFDLRERELLCSCQVWRVCRYCLCGMAAFWVVAVTFRA